MRFPAFGSRILIPLAILLVAAGVRCWDIEVKPPHFDEGINGWFADGMKSKGYFEYDPTNYHGPLHFYAVYVSQTLFGRSLWALRLPAVLAGLLAVWLVLRSERFFGATTARWAALAMALSPAMVFYSRYSIHESWQVLFNLMFFLGVLGLWQNGKRRDLFLTIAGITGMILTKETYIIQIGCLLLALPCLAIWNRIIPGASSLHPVAQTWNRRELFGALAVAVAAIVFFYSGNFQNWSGLSGLWQTHLEWMQTGVKSGGHEKTAYDLVGPFNWYWVYLMARYEWPALLGLLACIGCLFPVSPTLRLTAIYGTGLLLAYSIIPYKTPWCIISLLWPFLLVGPGFLGTLRPIFRRVGWVVLSVSILVSALGMWRLNFQVYADPSEPYVYVQTFPEIRVLTRPLLQLAEEDPRQYQLRGLILVDSYYPLPWMLGDFSNIAYFGSDGWPASLDADFILADEAKADEVRNLLQEEYVERYFRIREAQEPCIVFFRKEKFQSILNSLREEGN